MLASGVQPFTMLDFPHRIACIIFLAGCNFRCGYCHNPEFVLPEKIQQIRDSFIPEEFFFKFLKERKGLLDGVVVSGGEPTIHADLPDFFRKIKDFGFLLKLDTNGSNPEMIKQMHASRLIDYIAMDLKSDLLNYVSLVGDRVNPQKIKESIEFIKSSGVEYEFRSTLVKEIHTKELLENMAELVSGANQITLQTFRPAHTLDSKFGFFHPFSFEEMEEIKKNIFSSKVKEVVLLK